LIKVNGNEEEIRRIEKDRLELNAAYSDEPTESERFKNSRKKESIQSNDDVELLRDLDDRIDRYNFIQ
jgi:hypothetical protein